MLIREIRNIAVFTGVLGILQILITVPAGYFGYAAVLGTLLGCAAAIINFALMGIILEKCVSAERGAAGLMGFGYIGRLAIIAAAVVWAMRVSYLNYVCVIIPLIFPQIAIFILNAVRNKERKSDDERT
ncbi:MAG: ATP synthase subunit I, partial [Firmicutes bacterium]|nr:ATP synthase subunit I [Bacillota bacterium]